MDKNDEGYNKAHEVHVLVLPYPIHGHLNPMLQFAKRLTSRGLKVTLAPTHYTAKSLHIDAGPITIDPISDGCDELGYRDVKSPQAYIERFRTVGSQTLAQLIVTPPEVKPGLYVRLGPIKNFLTLNRCNLAPIMSHRIEVRGEV
ncbi:UDP-glycosyltransferase 74G1 [Cinnamomum micranthum f. kanehirae]|uniref:UDP-glycosyltransferase 74G1 n=1 Tax=Cinnamomum micranthum f. kanehirae TaxID=337451 RepID=A0A3S3M271_9MAGN|nr:UDP-glycosyltransferase 74G1 [Cinnamomum micranthum f. kanehirae]